MFGVLFNGSQYLIAPIGGNHPGWLTISCAGTLEEGYLETKKDWDHYWSLCGLVPSRPISVMYG